MRLANSVPDLLAGASLAGLLVPEAVAYSALAGLPPQAGVVAMVAGLACYGLLGRSRYAVVSATSSSAAVLASATLFLAGPGGGAQRLAYASMLVVGAGLAFLASSALRLGAMSYLVARPVLRGYSFGLAIVIAVKQWPALAGVHADRTELFPLLAQLLRAAGDWQLPSLACGLAALAGLFALERAPRLPGALVVIAAGIAAAPWLAAHGIALTGPVDFAVGLPVFALPAAGHWLPIVEFSLALMFILYAESYTSIRTFALLHDEEVRPNRDLLALGVANVAAGLLHGTAVGAGYSATAANDAAGARSRAAGLVAAGIVVLLILTLRDLVARIPLPVLAAIVIHAVSKMLRPGAFSAYVRWGRDLPIAIAAVLAVMLLGVLNGLLAAIAFSIAMLLKSLAVPRLAVLGRVGAHDYVSIGRFPEAVTVPGTLVLRPEEPLFFVNAEPLLAQVRARVLAAPAAHRVVLSLEESPDLDSTTLEALGELCVWLAGRGRELRVARLKDAAREALARARLPMLPPEALDYSSVDDAVSGTSVTPRAP